MLEEVCGLKSRHTVPCTASSKRLIIRKPKKKEKLFNTSALGKKKSFNLLNPTGYVMHQQFNIQQLYALPTLNLYVLYLSENKQRLVSLTA